MGNWNDPYIRLDPGVGQHKEQLKDRRACPTCDSDLTIERLNDHLHKLTVRAREQSHKMDNKTVPRTMREFEERYDLGVETFDRRKFRSETQEVRCYYETCADCGTLYDPYFHQRRAELERVIALMAQDLGIGPIDQLAWTVGSPGSDDD